MHVVVTWILNWHYGNEQSLQYDSILLKAKWLPTETQDIQILKVLENTVVQLPTSCAILGELL